MNRFIHSASRKLLPVVAIWLLCSGVNPGKADDRDDSSPTAIAVDVSLTDAQRRSELSKEIAIETDQKSEKSKSSDEKKGDPGNATEKTSTDKDPVAENVGDSRIYPSLPIRQIKLKPGVNPEKYASFLMELGFHAIYLSPDGNTLVLRWADDEEEQSIKSVLTELGVIATPLPNAVSRIPAEAYSSTAERTAGTAETAETRALRLQLLALESRSEGIAEEMRRGLPQLELAKMRQELDAHLTDALSLKCELEELEIKEFEQRLAELRTQMQRRRAASKQIVRRRAEELVKGESRAPVGKSNTSNSPEFPSPSPPMTNRSSGGFQSMMRKPEGDSRDVKDNVEYRPRRILVAMKDIMIGESLDTSNMEVMSWPHTPLPEDAATDLQVTLGRVALKDIPRNSPIFNQDLGHTSLSGISSSIPVGFALVEVPINRAENERGLIRVGTHVNVSCAITYPASSGRPERTIVRPVAGQMKIVAIGERSSVGDPNKLQSSPLEFNDGVMGLIAPPFQVKTVRLAKKLNPKQWYFELVKEPTGIGVSGSEAEAYYQGLEDAHRDIQSPNESNNRQKHLQKQPAQSDGPVNVPFGALIVNLNEPKLSKFLSVDISIQTTQLAEQTVKRQMETKYPLLKNRLMSVVAEKTLEDVRGAQGIERLSTEMRDTFNDVLFKGQAPQITDVLFQEFHVQ